MKVVFGGRRFERRENEKTSDIRNRFSIDSLKEKRCVG